MPAAICQAIFCLANYHQQLECQQQENVRNAHGDGEISLDFFVSGASRLVPRY